MKKLLVLAVAAAFLVLWLGTAFAQEVPAAGVKPDLPLDQPAPPADDNDDEDQPPEDPPPDDPPPQDDEDPENPPPEFFDEPVEASNVVFVVDRTGSMNWSSSLSIEDEEGNPINNAKKITVARMELIKAIQGLSEDIYFGIVGYSSKDPSTRSTDPNWNGGGWSPERFVELFDRHLGNYWAVRDTDEGTPEPFIEDSTSFSVLASSLDPPNVLYRNGYMGLPVPSRLRTLQGKYAAITPSPKIAPILTSVLKSFSWNAA